MSDITPIQEIVARYMHAQRLTYRGVAAAMTKVLAGREHPPRSISHQAVAYWRGGVYRPEAPLFEYIRDHAQDESLREFAVDVLAAMADPAPAPAPAD